MRRLVFALLLLAPLAWAPPAPAGQDDPRLGRLFEELQAAESDTVGYAISQKIWEIWTVHGDPKIDALMNVGMAAMGEGNLALALATFESVIEKAPKFAEGWNKRATVYYMMGRYKDSAADVERTLALEPRHYGAISGLGLIHLQQGDDKAALADFERALEVNPRMPLIRLRVRELKEQLKGRAI